MDAMNQIADYQLSQLKVEWVDYHDVRPNTYNPNRMGWHERMLLRASLLEDGWTQPIVTLPDGQIVDGEQRWTTAGLELHPSDVQDVIDRMLRRQKTGAVVSESILQRLNESKKRLEEAIAAGEQKPTLASITGGKVPITRVDLGDDAHKMISTIRHNRARGSHQVDVMANILQDLDKMGLDIPDLETRLGMDDEEIQRLSAFGNFSLESLAADEFNNATTMVHIGDLTDDEEFKALVGKGQPAQDAAQEYEELKAQGEDAIRDEILRQQRELEREKGQPLNQVDRDKIEEKVRKTAPIVPKPQTEPLKKFMVFLPESQYQTVFNALLLLGGGQPEGIPIALVKLCEKAHESQSTS